MKTQEEVQIDAKAMRALGFESVPARQAHLQQPSASKDGDDVWFHTENSRMWFQGLPVGKSVFRMIYAQGVRDGEESKAEQIRLAIGA